MKYFVKKLSKKYVQECKEEYERWKGGKLCEERVVNYVEGSIVVDIIDTLSNSIIWHGAAYHIPVTDNNNMLKRIISKFDVALLQDWTTNLNLRSSKNTMTKCSIAKSWVKE